VEGVKRERGSSSTWLVLSEIFSIYHGNKWREFFMFIPQPTPVEMGKGKTIHVLFKLLQTSACKAKINKN